MAKKQKFESFGKSLTDLRSLNDDGSGGNIGGKNNGNTGGKSGGKNNSNTGGKNGRNTEGTTSYKMSDLEEIEKVMDINEDFKKEYVDKAHDVIAGLGTYKVITKTKIRSIYNMLCDIIDDEKHSSDAEISNESQMALRMFKVRVIYDCGRDDSVKAFVKRSHIIGYMLDIGSSRDKFDIYCKYFESLIAYHRFLYGDKD